MRILVISDIHGNFKESILQIAAENDLTLCLGDLGLDSEAEEEGLAFIRSLASRCRLLMIPGNCDEGCLQATLAENPQISLHKRIKEVEGYSFAGYGGAEDTASYIRRIRSCLLSGAQPYTETTLRQAEKSQWLQQFLEAIGVSIHGGHIDVTPEAPEMLEQWAPLRSPCEFQDFMIREFLVTEATHSDIWVLHVPPFGFPGSERICGLSTGSKSVLDAITAVQPRLAISGHIHRAGRWVLGRTTCISAPAMEDNLALLVRIDEAEVSSEVVNIG